MQQVINVPEGTPNQTSLGFVANTVTVNNITQSWAYVPAAQTFIPPYQYGVVIPIPGTDNVDIQWRTPTSLPSGPVGTGTLAATYTDASLAPSNGVSVFAQSTQTPLGVVPASGTVTFLLPGGCQAIMLIPVNGKAVQAAVTGTVANPLTGFFDGYFSGAGPAGLPVIVPLSPLEDSTINVHNSDAGFPLIVVALFTSQIEPVTTVTVSPAAGALFNENLTQIAGVPVIGAAGTLGVDIRDVGGSSTGALNVNIADLNGSASVVGQQTMAASFPVVIASNQSAVAENLTQVGGTALALGSALSAASIPVVIASDDTVAISAATALPENLTQIRSTNVASVTGFKPGTLPVEGWSQYGLPGLQSNLFLQVVQRPTILLLSLNINVIVAGSVLIAAPGVGSSIVLRKLRMTISAAALAPDSVVLGTALTGNQLATFRIPTAAAASPQAPEYFMDWDDYLVGDNLPVDISSNVATFLNTGVNITYCIISTATWPTV